MNGIGLKPAVAVVPQRQVASFAQLPASMPHRSVRVMRNHFRRRV
jgi:hypothetical protein